LGLLDRERDAALRELLDPAPSVSRLPPGNRRGALVRAHERATAVPSTGHPVDGEWIVQNGSGNGSA
jgi:hypothetical protein